MNISNLRKRKDRDIYVPYPRRAQQLLKDKLSTKCSNESIEFLGRYGRINSYEFEFQSTEDAKEALRVYNSNGQTNRLDISLVKHVEAPRDYIMSSRRLLYSGKMASDVEESYSKSSQYSNDEYYILEKSDLRVPPSYRNLHWRSIPTHFLKESSSLAVEYEQIQPQEQHHLRNESYRLNDRDSLTQPSNQIKSKMNSQMHITKANCHTFSSLPSSLDAMISENNDHFHSTEEMKIRSTDIMLVPIPSWRGFMFEIIKRFPSALAKRLLVAMWVMLNKSDPTVANISINTNNRQNYSASLEDLTNHLDKIERILQYFKKVLQYVLQSLQQNQSLHENNKINNLEAAHFICYIYIILGDLCRYRDVQYKNNASLQFEGTLFAESLSFYQLAYQLFPQEGRTYSQLAKLSIETGDILGEINYTFVSTLCCFRSRDVDTLTSLLGNNFLNIHCVTENNNEILFLKNKIGLEQFPIILEELMTLLRDIISTSVSTPLLNQLFTGLKLIIFMIIEASEIIQNQIALGEDIDNRLKAISLKPQLLDILDPIYTDFFNMIKELNLILSENPTSISSFYVIDDIHYTTTSEFVTNIYSQLVMNFSHLFYLNKESILNLLATNEKFQLSFILLVRIAIVILENIESPLSPFFGLLSLIVFWLYSTNLLNFELSFKENSINKLSSLRVRRCNYQKDIISQVEYFRKRLCHIVYKYGKEAYKLNQIKSYLLQYNLCEDNFMQGLLNVPLIFCVLEDKNKDKHTTNQKSLCGKLVSHIELLRESVKHESSKNSFSNASLEVCPIKQSCFVDVDKLFFDECSTQNAKWSNNSHFHDNEKDMKSFENLMTSSQTCHSVDESLVNISNTKSVLNHDVTCFEQEYTHVHIEANIMCPNTLTSTVRLSRLLLLFGDLPDFQNESQLDKELWEKEHPNHNKINLSKSTSNITSEIHSSMNMPIILSPKDESIDSSITSKRGLIKVKNQTLDNHNNKESAYDSTFDRYSRYNVKSPMKCIRGLGSASDDNFGKGPNLNLNSNLKSLNKHLSSESTLDQNTSLNSVYSTIRVPMDPNIIDGIDKYRRDKLGIHSNERKEKLIIVIDGSNVALEHGNSKKKKDVPFNLLVAEKDVSTDTFNEKKHITLRSSTKMKLSSDANETEKKLDFDVNETEKKLACDINETEKKLDSDVNETEKKLDSDVNETEKKLDSDDIQRKKKSFSSLGIQLALEYYIKRNYIAVAFVPDYVIDYDRVGDNKRIELAGLGVRDTKVPDSVELLRKLCDDKVLFPINGHDYDDSYVIKYAKQCGGCVVTNDRYRDSIIDCQDCMNPNRKCKDCKKIRKINPNYVCKQCTTRNRYCQKNHKNQLKKWLKKHLISFSFVSNDFIPNPDFVYPDD